LITVVPEEDAKACKEEQDLVVADFSSDNKKKKVVRVPVRIRQEICNGSRQVRRNRDAKGKGALTAQRRRSGV